MTDFILQNVPSSSAWSSLTNATSNLTLANGTNTTEFDQTSNTTWTWKNTTTATNSTTNASPTINLVENYWTGAASAADTWTIASSLASGTNGASTLTFTHTGSSGTAAVKLPNTITQNIQTSGITLATGFGTGLVATIGADANRVGAFYNNGTSGGNTGTFYGLKVFGWYSGTAGTTALDTGISRTTSTAGSVSIGNGTAGDTTGNLQLNLITKYGGVSTVSNGVPAEYATVDLTTQSAAITATTLYAVPASGAGLYRISFYAKITTAASVSSVLGGTNGFQITYTDPTDSTTPTVTVADQLTNALNANSTTTADCGSCVIAAKASTNIQYTYDYTSAGVTAMQYKISIKLEFLG